MFIIMWRYRVLPEFDDEFRQAYGLEGDWARLFQVDPAFLSTELVASDEPGVYLTIDRWDDSGSYDRFRSAQSDGYKRLDRRFEKFTMDEDLVFTGTLL